MEKNQINLFTIQDLYNHYDKGDPVDITKKYDPLYFWDDFGDKYLKSFKKPQEVAKYVPYLSTRLKSLKVDTLLDTGCGFCRVEPFLLDNEVVKDIVAIDISQKQLDSAKVYLEPTIPVVPERNKYEKEEDFKKAEETYKKEEEIYKKALERNNRIHIEKQTIKWSNTPPNSYDCVLSVECMQHIHLSSVRYAIKELEKLTRKYVVIVERFVYNGEHPFPHLWSHNYWKLATDIGLKVLESKMIDNGVIAMVFEK